METYSSKSAPPSVPAPAPEPVAFPAPAPPPYSGPPMAVYQVQPAAHNVQVHVAQQPQPAQPVPAVIAIPPLRDGPGRMTCPYCQQHIVTVTHHKNGALNWLICGLMAVFVIWPFCLIPFCVKSCKDVEHTCPSCNAMLHTYKRI